MATTATFDPIAISDTGWVLVADGATYQHVFVQMGEAVFPVMLYVGATIADLTDDTIEAFILLDRERDKSFSIDLGTGDKLYARSKSGNAKIRGHRKTV